MSETPAASATPTSATPATTAGTPGTGAPGATGAEGGTGGTPTPAANGIEWLSGADEATTGYVQNKAWKTPLEAVQSYQNLEKLLGADRAGRTIILPGESATPEEMTAFYNRLGRPAEASGYKLEVPEGIGDAKFAETAANWFHEEGLTAKQAEGVTARWNKHVAEQIEAQKAAHAQAFTNDQVALEKEWGAALEQNRVIAKNAASAIGLDDKFIDSMSSVIGHKATMETLHRIGVKMGEDSFVQGKGGEGIGGALTPAQARAKITELQKDSGFRTRYLNGDAAAKSEMERLHKFAFPEVK